MSKKRGQSPFLTILKIAGNKVTLLTMKCPGQDTRHWKPEDIFEIKCPFCGVLIEFFKDDTRRRCKNCKNWVPNPKLDLGCIDWCEFAEKCVDPEMMKKKSKKK